MLEEGGGEEEIRRELEGNGVEFGVAAWGFSHNPLPPLLLKDGSEISDIYQFQLPLTHFIQAQK